MGVQTWVVNVVSAQAWADTITENWLANWAVNPPNPQFSPHELSRSPPWPPNIKSLLKKTPARKSTRTSAKFPNPSGIVHVWSIGALGGGGHNRTFLSEALRVTFTVASFSPFGTIEPSCGSQQSFSLPWKFASSSSNLKFKPIPLNTPLAFCNRVSGSLTWPCRLWSTMNPVGEKSVTFPFLHSLQNPGGFCVSSLAHWPF